MNEATFAEVVSARLDPILAPRGFPYAAHQNGMVEPGEPAVSNPDSVLFHSDGVDAVADVMARYPGWSPRLRESYGLQEIICLDLWVEQERKGRSWNFEIFDSDVLDIAGSGAKERLSRLAMGPIDEWADQLARMLDAYFSQLESAASSGER